MYLLNEIKEIFMYLFDIFVICLYLCIYRAWAGAHSLLRILVVKASRIVRYPDPVHDPPSPRGTRHV